MQRVEQVKQNSVLDASFFTSTYLTGKKGKKALWKNSFSLKNT